MKNRFPKQLYFLILTLALGVGVSACGGGSADAPALQTADSTPVQDEAAPQGCALASNQQNPLCHLVPATGEGEMTLAGSALPKGFIKNEFDEEGRVTRASLFGEQTPSIPTIVTETEYDSQGRIAARKLSLDLNTDQKVDTVDETTFSYLDEFNFSETGTRILPQSPMLPPSALENTVQSLHLGSVSMDMQTGESHSYRSENTVTRRRLNGNLASVESLDVNFTDDKLTHAKFRIFDCGKLSCPPNFLPPVQATSTITTEFKIEGGELISTETEIDADGNGNFGDAADNKIDCTVSYDEGNTTPIRNFPAELKKLGFSGKKIPLSIDCSDKNGNQSEFRVSWKPLWQALGKPEPK